MNFFQNLVSCRVLPVIIARDVESTVHLAQSLQRGGMRAVEITLRTPAALDSLKEVKSALLDLLVAGHRSSNLRVKQWIRPWITSALDSLIILEMRVPGIH